MIDTHADFARPAGDGRRPELLDLGAGRIADMDEARIDIQVLSAMTPGAQYLPGAEGVAFARKLNDRIANEVVAVYPKRFRAFATLPLSEPGAATDELERAVREHGFVGCMSYGPIEGKCLDHADRAPVLARAETLGVPIYLHPNWPSPQAMEIYYDGLGDALASRILGGPGYGWHEEIALQCLRLIVSDTPDRFPRLQIVVGHMGEGLPFWYWRVGEHLDRIARDRLHKCVQRYIHDNLWITTSAFFRDELLPLAGGDGSLRAWRPDRGRQETPAISAGQERRLPVLRGVGGWRGVHCGGRGGARAVRLPGRRGDRERARRGISKR